MTNDDVMIRGFKVAGMINALHLYNRHSDMMITDGFENLHVKSANFDSDCIFFLLNNSYTNNYLFIYKLK